MQLCLLPPAPSSVGAPLDFSRSARLELGGGSWVEFTPNWLPTHQALFDQLRGSAVWSQQTTVMYERTLVVPRLLGHPTSTLLASGPLAAIQTALCQRYGRALDSITFAQYRDGRDSVAMHRDKLGLLIDDTVVAVLSLGAPRSFLLKPSLWAGASPVTSLTAGASAPLGKNRSLRYQLGFGDLFVMGGSCQRNWLHGVPKSRSATGPRISVMFREQPPGMPGEQAPRA